MTSRVQRREQLERGAAELAVALPAPAVEKLLAFLDLLYAWNRTARLTRVAPEDAVRLHLLDSLAIVPVVSAGSVADLGTGGGLPGIPLAIARDDVQVALVESNRRRCSFLSEAVREIAVPCEIVEMDVGGLTATGRVFDTVVSRAFRAPDEMPALAEPLLSAGGSLIVMSAPSSSADVEAMKATASLRVAEERRYVLPGGNEARLLVKLRRET
ncbi:MAG TPA: 16S rRNA (guanine(527)-N(7))-methyltransferase RsmG [Candidatus Limnocylindrales bacterium]|nr:16S rRNA (guanine(527)-N(7))-methyltransferase RsmG [Candidatus Limnocylindrales bacterium]